MIQRTLKNKKERVFKEDKSGMPHPQETIIADLVVIFAVVMMTMMTMMFVLNLDVTMNKMTLCIRMHVIIVNTTFRIKYHC